MHGPQSDHWRDTASLEYNILVENGTWEIVDLSEGQKTIGSGWVFNFKHKLQGSTPNEADIAYTEVEDAV